jgi:hypothetical protein
MLGNGAIESLSRGGRFMRQTAALLACEAAGADFFSRDIAMARRSTAEAASIGED